MHNQFWDEVTRPHGNDRMMVIITIDTESSWPNLIEDVNEQIPDDAEDIEVTAFKFQFSRPMNTGEVDKWLKDQRIRAEARREYHLRALKDIRETYGPDPENWPEGA